MLGDIRLVGSDRPSLKISVIEPTLLAVTVLFRFRLFRGICGNCLYPYPILLVLESARMLIEIFL